MSTFLANQRNTYTCYASIIIDGLVKIMDIFARSQYRNRNHPQPIQDSFAPAAIKDAKFGNLEQSKLNNSNQG
ncbi:MAG: hypothetical protein A2173_06020 [Planctomycetes bacterium RBG_13_44_8b]|nr:MAG: hypothetical protein A2173_06020 [Planctomycetes bacterium RBG_13_44_8b]